MSKLIYIDTNVYLDYFYDRRDKLKPLGEFAFELLSKSVSCMYKIIVSDITIFELNKKLPKNKVTELMNWLSLKTIYVNATKKDKDYARKYHEIHYPDSLHIILAKKNNSTLVSHDKEMQELGAISAQDL